MDEWWVRSPVHAQEMDQSFFLARGDRGEMKIRNEGNRYRDRSGGTRAKRREAARSNARESWLDTYTGSSLVLNCAMGEATQVRRPGCVIFLDSLRKQPVGSQCCL